MVSGLSALGFDPNAPATAQPVCILVTPNTLTARRISFIFNKLVCRRSRCGSTGTLVSPFLSPPCEPFPLQQGGTPPLLYPERSPRRAHLHRLPFLQSALFPALHPISLQSLTKCSSRNFFVLTTIHFHGGCTPPRVYPEPAAAWRGGNLAGEGRLSHSVLESAALEHLQRATIQGSQPRGDTGRIKDCLCTGCGTIARTETIERKRRS
jgi:hypothetical protein